jgi:hypothetical protein
MPTKETVDPKTGAVTWDWVDDGTPAPKPQAQAAKPAAPKPQPQSNPLLSVLDQTPIGWMSELTGNSVDSIGAGIQEFQRTGDLGKAITKGQQQYGQGLQGPGIAKGVVRTVAGGTVDLLQNTSNLLQDVAAKAGVPGAVPTSPTRKDTNFLGVLPPLPRIPSSGPIEDLGRGLVQIGLSIIPINSGVGLAGLGLRMLPGGLKVAKAATATRAAIAASKPAQAISKAPVLGPAAGAIAENVTTKAAATGAIVDMLISDPYSGRVYDHAEKFYESITGTPLEVPFENLLKADGNAIGLDARWGLAIDGAGLGSGLSFIYRQGKMAAAALRLRAAQEGVQAGRASALDVRKAQKDMRSAVENFADEVTTQAEAGMPKPTVQELIQQNLDQVEQVRTQLKELPKVKRGTTGYKEYQAARKELLAQEKAINLQVQQLEVQRLRERATAVNTTEAAPVAARQEPTMQGLPDDVPAPAGRVEPAMVDAPTTVVEAPAGVSDEAIAALEKAYPYRKYRGQTPADVAEERLYRVQQLQQTTADELEKLKAAGPEANDSATVAKKNKRDWDRNIAKLTKQAAQVEDDLVVAQAVLDRARGTVDAPTAAAADLPPQVFHGTNKANAAAIREGGFKASGPRGDVGNALGDGVFFTSNPKYAADYGPEVLSGNPAAAGIRLKTISNAEYEQLITSKYGGFDEYMFPKDQKALIKEFGNDFDGVRVTEGFGGPGDNVGDEIVVFDPKKADALINAAEPSVPSAGTPAPVAQASPQEIQELDATLAKSMANLSPEERVAVRDQMLAEKYGTGSPVEPPAPAAMADEVITPEVMPDVPQPRSVPLPDGEWADRFVRSLDANSQALNDQAITIDDLIDNNINKVQSPSGNTQYVTAQPDLVESYAAAMDAFTRQELGRPAPMDTQALKSWAVNWVEQNGFGDGKEVRQMLDAMSTGLADADRNEKALLLAAMYTDTATKAAGLSGKRWLNARLDPTANVSELAADLISAASAQQGAITSFTGLTSRLGRLMRVLQINRNLDEASAVANRGDAVAAPAVDIANEFTERLTEYQSKSLSETLGKPISQELTDAIETGVYSPKAIAELDLLAYSLEQAAVTPGYGKGFWDMMNKSVGIGAQGLVMYRSAQLLSSGLTISANVLNNTYRLLSLPLVQAVGATVSAGGDLALGRAGIAAADMARARDSMLMYGQYVSNLHNAFRLGIESFKVGRGLYDLDSSSVDFMDKLAKRGSNMLMEPAGEWTLNTVPWVGVWDNTAWGRVQKAVWATLNVSTRTQVSADTFFKTLAGQSFEYVRNLRPGLDAAVQGGMVPGSKEAWKFAKEYAQEMVDQQTRNVVVEGRTILDAVMEGPNAQTAMRWATFTDDITAKMEMRTPTRGREIAMARGMTDEAQIDEFVQKYIANNSEATPWFTGAPSFFPSTWQKLMDTSPMFTLIQPFNRTPGDIVKSTMRMTPLAPLVDTWWRDINSMDAFTRDRAWGDMAVGTAALGLAYAGLAGGNVRITGGPPIDPQARRVWYEIEQKQPFSISVLTGENELGQAVWSDWVSLRMFEPVAGILGAIGQFYEIQGRLTLEQRERMAGSIVLDTLTQVAAGQYSKTYFQGLVDLFEAAQGIVSGDSGPNNRNPAMVLLAKIAASFTPGSSSLRAARRIEDPMVRRPVASQSEGIEGDPTGISKYAFRLTEEYWQEVQNSVAGWSKELPPEISWITGTPMMLTGPIGAEYLPPEQPWLAWLYQYNPLSSVQIGPSQKDQVMLEMASLSGKGAAFAGPRSTDFGRERRLDAWQMRDYKLAIALTPDEQGRKLYDALEEEIRSERYQNLPREMSSSEVISYRAAALNMQIEKYRRIGRDAFLQQYPDLKDKLDNIEEANRKKKQQLQSGGTMGIAPTVEEFVEGSN